MTTSACPCADCGINTCPTAWDQRAEWYDVQDHVWAAAGMTLHGGYLCIGCLEARLGRRVDARDFTAAPINNPARRDNPRYAWSYRTPRLIDRLTSCGQQLTLTGM